MILRYSTVYTHIDGQQNKLTVFCACMERKTMGLFSFAGIFDVHISMFLWRCLVHDIYTTTVSMQYYKLNFGLDGTSTMESHEKLAMHKQKLAEFDGDKSS